MINYSDRIKPDDYGIGTYLESLLKQKYQIPTFQRDVIWEEGQVKKLWDSIYRFYPIGSILIWNTNIRLHKHRQIGGHEIASDIAQNEYKYILDGQQRTTALLTALYGGKIHDRKGFDPTLFVDLTVLGVAKEEDSYRQRFLFWHEIDDRDGALLANAGRAKRNREGLIVKLQDIRSNFAEVEERLHDAGYREYNHDFRQELRHFKNVLDNYRLPFIELRGIEVAEVCQIFERINQEGTPLDIFDIVVAKTYRPANRDEDVSEFYLRDVFGSLREKIPDGSKFADVDDLTILQMVATIIRQDIPDSGVHNITERYLAEIRAEWIEEVWDGAWRAIQKTYDFLDNILRIKGPTLVPYRYFYMSLAAYFRKNEKPDYDFLKKYFWYYSFHYDDLLTNTTHLRQHVESLAGEDGDSTTMLDQFRIDKESIRTASYSSRGRLSRAILTLFAHQKPKDWAAPYRDVLAEVYYTLTDKPNLHHIFPLDFIAKESSSNKVDANSLMNIAYLTQKTNLQISNRNPLSYLRDFDCSEFEAVLRDHLVPVDILEWSRMEMMPDNALDLFVEKRIDLVVERLRSLLAGIPFTVFDSRADNGAI